MSIDLRPQIPLDQVAIGDLTSVHRDGGVDSRITPIVAEVAQVSDSTYTADGNPVSITIDGATYALAIAGAVIADVVSGANAIQAFSSAGYIASNPAGAVLRITGPVGQSFAIVNTSATNLTAFATTQAAVSQPLARPGRAVMWLAAPNRPTYNLVGTPAAGRRFAGICLRMDLPSDTEALGLGETPGAMIPGRPFMAAYSGVSVLGDNRDAVTQSDPVYAVIGTGRLTNTPGGSASTLELTVTAGLAADDVGGSIDGGPSVTLPGGSTTVDDTDAAQLLPLFAAAYAGLYTFTVATNVITATRVAIDGVTPVFVDDSGGGASIADVAAAGSAEDAVLCEGLTFISSAGAGEGANVLID
jgi:hypothetical protein